MCLEPACVALISHQGASAVYESCFIKSFYDLLIVKTVYLTERKGGLWIFCGENIDRKNGIFIQILGIQLITVNILTFDSGGV